MGNPTLLFIYFFYCNVFGLEWLESPEGRVLEERFQELRSVYLCRISHAAGGEVSMKMDGEGGERWGEGT